MIKTFKELPGDIQECISRNKLDLDLEQLTDKQVERLQTLTPEELWEAWLEWNGFIGWDRALHRVHKEVFGG